MSERNNAIGPNVRARHRRALLVPALAAVSLVAGLATATQLFAWEFGRHSALGWNADGAYPPWAILEWAARWYRIDSRPFVKWGSAGTLVTACLLLAVALYARYRRNTARPNLFLHGSARWADRADLERAGLLDSRRADDADVPAVYVGSWIDGRGAQHYLRHSGPEHVLCIAPTRSGKGVALVVPTLLSWPASAVVTDLKGELWAMTAGWRGACAGNTMLRFEPAAAAGQLCLESARRDPDRYP